MSFNYVIHMTPNLSMDPFTRVYVSTKGMQSKNLLRDNSVHIKS